MTADSKDFIARAAYSHAVLLSGSLNHRAGAEFSRSLERSRRDEPRKTQSPLRGAHPRAAGAVEDAAQLVTPVRRSPSPTPAPAIPDYRAKAYTSPGAGLPRVDMPSSLLALRRRPENVAAALQTARAQALRAEIRRCAALVSRLSRTGQRPGHVRLTLPASLFPDTIVELERRGDGWHIKIHTPDDDSRAALRDGIAELQRRFARRGLGDIHLARLPH